MSRYIATRAIRGANALVIEAEAMLQKGLSEKGPDTIIEFPNTAYYLPLIYGMTGIEITKLEQLTEVLRIARKLLHLVPANQSGRLIWAKHWTAGWPLYWLRRPSRLFDRYINFNPSCTRDLNWAVERNIQTGTLVCPAG